jgi:hypothetical protein
MVTTGMITGIEIDPNSNEGFCEACAKAKATCKPFPKESKTRANKYGERVHWDLWGPASVSSLGRNQYAACRTNDQTREVMIYFIAKKSEVFETYKNDEALIETQHDGAKIKLLRSDRGGEFLSDKFKDHLAKRGTKHELTVHNSPQQDGVSKRGMCTHAEHARALLLAAGLPRYLWAEAMLHSVWLQNRSSTCGLNGKTPYEMAKGKKPHLAVIQEFGAAVYIKDLNAGKLDPEVQKGCFVGYDSQSKGYRIYWPNKWSISVERDVTFNPDDIHLQSEESVVIFGDVLHEGEKDKIIQPNDTITSNKNQHDSNEDIPHDETETYSGTSSQSTAKPRSSHDMLPELNLTPARACMHSYPLEPIGLSLKEQMTQLQLHISQHFPVIPNWMTKAWNKGERIMLTRKLMIQYVRGHPSISFLPLSSPTLHLFICIPPPHLCTIFKDHT